VSHPLWPGIRRLLRRIRYGHGYVDPCVAPIRVGHTHYLTFVEFSQSRRVGGAPAARDARCGARALRSDEALIAFYAGEQRP